MVKCLRARFLSLVGALEGWVMCQGICSRNNEGSANLGLLLKSSVSWLSVFALNNVIYEHRFPGGCLMDAKVECISGAQSRAPSSDGKRCAQYHPSPTYSCQI